MKQILLKENPSATPRWESEIGPKGRKRTEYPMETLDCAANWRTCAVGEALGLDQLDYRSDGDYVSGSYSSDVATELTDNPTLHYLGGQFYRGLLARDRKMAKRALDDIYRYLDGEGGAAKVGAKFRETLRENYVKERKRQARLFGDRFQARLQTGGNP